MNQRAARVLDCYEARLQCKNPIVAAFSAAEYLEQRDHFLRGIGAASGMLLNILIKAARPRLIVEAGTSYGYSTNWLADAGQHAPRLGRYGNAASILHQ